VNFSSLAIIFLFVFALLSVFLIIRSSEWFTILLVIHPFYSLAILIGSNRSDFNLLTFCLDFITLVLLVIVAIRRKVLLLDSLTSFVLLSFVIAIAVAIGINNGQTGVAKIIALKFLIFPFAALLLGQVSMRFVSRLHLAFFCLSIANFIFAFLQLRWGFFKFAETGLGSQQLIRFADSRIRAPGLTPGAFYLGLLSAFQFCLSWNLIRSRFHVTYRFMRYTVPLSCAIATANIFLSSSRSSVLFVLTFLLYFEVASSRGSLRRLMIIVLIPSLGFLLYFAMNKFAPILLGTKSLAQRLTIWNQVISSTDWFYGTGVGSVGSASNSSFANSGSARFIDNQFLNFYLQYGILYLLVFCVILTLMWKRTDSFGRSLLFALTSTSFLLELWEYTALSLLIVLFASQVKVVGRLSPKID